MTFFDNRKDAANKLIEVLPIDKMKEEEWIILSASSGGTVIASQISKELNSKTDFIITEKIFAPNNETCEIAIISESQELVIHEQLLNAFGLKLNDIFNQAKQIHASKICQDIEEYRNNNSLIDVQNKNILIVDEGLNTGLTMMACIKTILNLGAKSVSVAVPILPESIIGDIESIADDLYFVKSIPHFISIDFYYKDLENITCGSVQNNIINKKEDK